MTPREAEVACENIFRQQGFLTRRVLRAKFAKVDFFGCDVVAKSRDGSTTWVQVTTGKSETLRRRRRKLETVPWAPTDNVCVYQLVQRPSAVRASRLEYFFRVHWFRTTDRTWILFDNAIPVTREMTKVGRNKT